MQQDFFQLLVKIGNVLGLCPEMRQVTVHGGTIQEALKSTLGKLKSSLDATLDVCKTIKMPSVIEFFFTAVFCFHPVLT